MLDSAAEAVAPAASPDSCAAAASPPAASKSRRAGRAARASSAARSGRWILVDSVTVALGGPPVLRGATVAAEAGRTLVILGPSGCGKTTLLRVLAGLQRVDEGRVMLGGRLVSAGGRRETVHVAADKRRVGMVFQDWSLFPHLTVAANVAFGLPRSERPRSRFLPRPASDRVRRLLDLVGIAELSDRLPGSLSGGQQQRVALARALAPEPTVLLMDEPFSSLDTALRTGVRSEVAALLRELGVTCVFVTHDQGEAFVLGDEVAVMRDGEVVQQASPAALYEHPVDRWVAGFVGEADVLAGRAEGDAVRTALGTLLLRSPARGAVDVLVRPEEVRILPEVPGKSSGASAVVERVDYFGHDTLYHVRTDGGDVLHSRATGSPQFAPGASVRLRHSGRRTAAFPSKGA